MSAHLVQMGAAAVKKKKKKKKRADTYAYISQAPSVKLLTCPSCPGR